MHSQSSDFVRPSISLSRQQQGECMSSILPPWRLEWPWCGADTHAEAYCVASTTIKVINGRGNTIKESAWSEHCTNQRTLGKTKGGEGGVYVRKGETTKWWHVCACHVLKHEAEITKNNKEISRWPVNSHGHVIFIALAFCLFYFLFFCILFYFIGKDNLCFIHNTRWFL